MSISIPDPVKQLNAIRAAADSSLQRAKRERVKSRLPDRQLQGDKEPPLPTVDLRRLAAKARANKRLTSRALGPGIRPADASSQLSTFVIKVKGSASLNDVARDLAEQLGLYSTARWTDYDRGVRRHLEL